MYQCGVRAEEKIILRVLKLVLEYSYAFTSRRRCPCSARSWCWCWCFGAGRARAHAGGLVEVVAAQRLHRNQHTPALAVMLYSTDEVALFAEDFAMDVYPSAVAAALEQALSASTPFRVRDLPLGSAAKAKDVLQLARHLVERGVCCRLN